MSVKGDENERVSATLKWEQSNEIGFILLRQIVDMIPLCRTSVMLAVLLQCSNAEHNSHQNNYSSCICSLNMLVALIFIMFRLRTDN